MISLNILKISFYTTNYNLSKSGKFLSSYNQHFLNNNKIIKI